MNKKLALFLLVLLFDLVFFSVCSQTTSEPTIEQTMEWLITKCSSNYDYRDKYDIQRREFTPGKPYDYKYDFTEQQYGVTLSYDPVAKEINYRISIYPYKVCDESECLHRYTRYIKFNISGLSNCQITDNKPKYNDGLGRVVIKLNSNERCQLFTVEKGVDYRLNINPRYWQLINNGDKNYMGPKECELVEKKYQTAICKGNELTFCYKAEDMANGDRIIKAIQHLIKLTGGTLEPF